MRKHVVIKSLFLTVLTLQSSSLISTASACGYEKCPPPPPPPPPPKELEGRMTGGGSIFCPGVGRVTHGFELHCDADDVPNNLEINFSGGNNFHLVALTDVACTDTPLNEAPPVAGFDTMVGEGVGTFNNEPGYSIEFELTDAGEPGVNDTFSFTIRDDDDNVVLSCPERPLRRGNHQAHRVTGNASR